MPKYSANLRLPFETASMINGVQRKCDLTKLGHFDYDKQLFSKDMLGLLTSRGMDLWHYEVFYTPPQRHLAIHVDGSKLSNVAKINWVWGATGSRMMWWKMRSGKEMSIGTTPVGTNYLYTNQQDCIMIESAKIGQPTMVNAGVPHSVINNTNEGRWCLSVVPMKDGQNVQWQEACELLKDFLI